MSHKLGCNDEEDEEPDAEAEAKTLEYSNCSSATSATSAFASCPVSVGVRSGVEMGVGVGVGVGPACSLSLRSRPCREPAGADGQNMLLQLDRHDDAAATAAAGSRAKTGFKYLNYRSRSANQLSCHSRQLEPTVLNLDVIMLEASRKRRIADDDADDADHAEYADYADNPDDPDDDDDNNYEELDADVDMEMDVQADPDMDAQPDLSLDVEMDVDEDVEMAEDAPEPDGDKETTQTVAYSYGNESSNEYRPGGYHPVAIGDCFQQRYFVVSKLGWGHYSTVWLCFDTERQSYCAVKLVKSAELYAESARHEIRLLRYIQQQLSWHPLRERIVNLTDNFCTSGVNGTHQCLVFDVLGDNMLMLIQRSGYQGLPLYNVKQIAYQVLQGLYLLHDQSNLIHTDLKPENVLLVGDDVALRSQATYSSKKYLQERMEQQLAMAKLSKTAKRRQRAKTKQSIRFFQSHRKWLRERGIADLLQLAQHGLLTVKMAFDAVTDQLPFLPYDGPHILSAEDVQRLERSGQSDDQTEDSAVGSSSATNGRSRQRHNAGGSKMLKLLQRSPEKFMRHVQKCVESDTQEDSVPYRSFTKRVKSKRPAKKSLLQRKSDARIYQRSETQSQSQSQSPASAPANCGSTFASSSSSGLNMNLIKRKDPALEPCKLKVAIADVGNACFIDHHVTEDIQTREYRAIEVILGAGYDTSADLWSAACLFWELATGEYLFQPNKWRGDASQDEVHVAHIVETCGPIPKELIERGEYSTEIFGSDGHLLNIKHLVSHPLNKVLMERYNWPAKEAKEFADFLMPMLCTDPLRRVTAYEAIDHPWLLLDEGESDEEDDEDDEDDDMLDEEDIGDDDDDNDNNDNNNNNIDNDNDNDNIDDDDDDNMEDKDAVELSTVKTK